MTERREWLAILDVALDALRVKDYERAWKLFDELDDLHPTWLFEIKREQVRRDTGKQQTPHLRTLAWMFRNQGMTYERIGQAFDLSGQRAKELQRGGESQVRATFGELGELEVDFEPADVRREKRRAEHEKRERFRTFTYIEASRPLAPREG